MLATFAMYRGEQRHECVEGKSIRENRFVAAVEVATRDSRRIEREAHVGKTGADKLGIDSRVMRKRGAEQSLIIIKLVSEDVLELEAFDCCSNLPK
jgi:hypothetical protein